MPDAREQLAYCAMCPNICRAAWPRERGRYPEAEAPSAIAFLALAVADGRVQGSVDVLAALRRLDVAEVCSGACPHGVDLPHAVRSLSGGETA